MKTSNKRIYRAYDLAVNKSRSVPMQMFVFWDLYTAGNLEDHDEFLMAIQVANGETVELEEPKYKIRVKGFGGDVFYTVILCWTRIAKPVRAEPNLPLSGSKNIGRNLILTTKQEVD